MKKRARNPYRLLSAGLCLFALLVNNTHGALQWWDPTGTTVSATPNGTWENNVWAPTTAMTASTAAWSEANFAVGFAAGTGATGTYTVTMNANHNFAGIFNNGSISGSSAGKVTITGSGTLTLASGPQGFSTASGATTTILVPIAGTGIIQNQSSGSLYLYGNNSGLSGGIQLNTTAGLNFNNNNSFGSGSITWLISGTVLATPVNDGNGNTGATAPITLGNSVVTIPGNQIFVGIPAAPVTFTGPWTLPIGGTVTFQNQPAGTTVTISGAITGSAAFTKAGAGTLVLSGAANSYAGATTVSAGTLQLGNASALGRTVGSVSSGAVLDLSGTANVNAALVLTGTGISSGGALINSSGTSSTLILGDSVVGVTVTANGSGYSSVPTVNFSGGGGGGAVATALLGVTAASFTITPNTQTYTVAPAATITGGGGAGATATAILTANKVTGVTITAPGGGFTTTPTLTFSGGTIQTAGTVPTAAGNASNFQVSSVKVTAGGSGYTSAPSLSFSSGAATAAAKIASVVLAAASSVGGAGNITINSVVSGTGPLTKVGVGTVTLAAANAYTGGTTLGTGGLLNFANTSAMPAGTFTISGNGFFDNTSGADLTVANAMTLSGGSPTYVGSANNMTINGAVTLSVANRTITVSANTLTVGAIGQDASARNLTKQGNGTLVISGACTYTGNTTVSAGTLTVNGSIAAGGTVTVASGAKLGGAGTINTATTVSSGGTLAPGSSIGTLTFGNTLTLSGTTIMEINSTGNAADKIVMSSGPLAFGGVLTVNNIGPALVGGETFDLFDASGFTAAFTATNLPALGVGLNWWTGNLGTDGTITVNRAPTASDKAYSRQKGVTLKIFKSDLMTGVLDPDSGDSASYDALVGLGSQGANITEDANVIYYEPTNDISDTLQFRVKDTRGGTTTKNISITALDSTGQATSVVVSGSTATVNFAGIPGRAYQIQRSTNLVDWVTLVTTNAPGNGIFQWVDDFNDLGVPPADPPSAAYYDLKLP